MILYNYGLFIYHYVQTFAGKNDSASAAIKLPRIYTVQCEDYQWPITYRSSYNIGFLDIQKLQSFDTNVWEHVHQKLIGKLLS